MNLNAAWLLTALCLPALRMSGVGRLYFLLEDLRKVGGPLWGPYGVSKHALRALVGQLAAECQGSGIQVLGINPVAFLRAMRLNGVRRDLRSACSAGDCVQDVAARWGFWHLGHFVTDYKHMFGELPSQTLRAPRRAGERRGTSAVQDVRRRTRTPGAR